LPRSATGCTRSRPPKERKRRSITSSRFPSSWRSRSPAIATMPRFRPSARMRLRFSQPQKLRRNALGGEDCLHIGRREALRTLSFMSRFLLLFVLFIAAIHLHPVALSAAESAAIFRDTCSVCHGMGGKGDGPSSQRLEPKPADFTDCKTLAKDSTGDGDNLREELCRSF